jgi:hypothetical protein
MSRAARKIRRNASKQFSSSVVEITDVAGRSLGFTDSQLAEAHTGSGELADMLLARSLDLLEHLHGYASDDCIRGRAELEQRNGAGFLERVAATGEPAATAALRIRYIM